MFITFEGMEGCGKTTQIEKLASHFQKQNIPTLCTREPGGSKLGQELRRILLNPENSDLHPTSELFLYLADRTQHINSVIKPNLQAGKVVISDRFADSTIVYQGYGRKLDQEMLLQLNKIAVGDLWPDITILLDIEPEIGLERARKRNQAENIQDKEGRFEMEALSFHRTIRQGFLDWATQNPDRFVVVDASKTPDEIFLQISRYFKNIKNI